MKAKKINSEAHWKVLFCLRNLSYRSLGGLNKKRSKKNSYRNPSFWEWWSKPLKMVHFAVYLYEFFFFLLQTFTIGRVSTCLNRLRSQNGETSQLESIGWSTKLGKKWQTFSCWGPAKLQDQKSFVCFFFPI